jgi:hypothetical protein
MDQRIKSPKKNRAGRLRPRSGPAFLGYHRILAAGARVQLGTAYTLPEYPELMVNALYLFVRDLFSLPLKKQDHGG